MTDQPETPDSDKPERSTVFYEARRDIIVSMLKWSFGMIALVGLIVAIPYYNSRLNNISHLHKQLESQQALLEEQQRNLNAQQIAQRQNDFITCQATRKSRAQGNARASVLREFLATAADGREDSAKQELQSNPGRAELDLRLALRYRELRGKVHIVKLPTCRQLKQG